MKLKKDFRKRGQGALARRRYDSHVSVFPLASAVARKAVVAFFRNIPRRLISPWSKGR